jgi:type II secretory pathway pseudopilin PulG
MSVRTSRGIARAPLTSQAGITLVEILISVAILLVALVAVLNGFIVGTQGSAVGQQLPTAVFLAEQKIEQIKAWSSSTATGQGFAVLPSGNPITTGSALFVAEGYGAIANHSGYRRQVSILSGPSTSTRVLRVDVFYRPAASQKAASQSVPERRVTLSTLLANHQ